MNPAAEDGGSKASKPTDSPKPPSKPLSSLPKNRGSAFPSGAGWAAASPKAASEAASGARVVALANGSGRSHRSRRPPPLRSPQLSRSRRRSPRPNPQTQPTGPPMGPRSRSRRSQLARPTARAAWRRGHQVPPLPNRPRHPAQKPSSPLKGLQPGGAPEAWARCSPRPQRSCLGRRRPRRLAPSPGGHLPAGQAAGRAAERAVERATGRPMVAASPPRRASCAARRIGRPRSRGRQGARARGPRNRRLFLGTALLLEGRARLSTGRRGEVLGAWPKAWRGRGRGGGPWTPRLRRRRRRPRGRACPG